MGHLAGPQSPLQPTTSWVMNDCLIMYQDTNWPVWSNPKHVFDKNVPIENQSLNINALIGRLVNPQINVFYVCNSF